jgi:uncharacterized protein with PQ loop repeat
MVELLGWVGSICFSLAALPQAIQSYKDGHSNGLVWGLLLLWFVGEICTATYVGLTSQSIPLLVNYGTNFCFLMVIMRYKIWPRRDDV